MLNIISYQRKVHRNHSEIPLSYIRIAIIIQTDKTNVGEDVKKSDPSYTTEVRVKLRSHLESSFKSSNS